MRGPTFRPLDYEVFAGLDVDKRSSAVTFTTPQGFLKSLRMPYRVEHLRNHVRKHFPAPKGAFAYEAGPTGYGLSEGLVAQAYRCLIASPSLIPTAPGQRVKTNRRDSRGVSETLRGGQLKSLPGPSAVYRELRPLTQRRETFVSERVALKQRSKSLLLLAGSEFPPAPVGSQWSVLVKDHLRTLPCSTTVRFQLEQVLDSLAVNAQQVVKTTTEIRRFCQHAPELGQCLKSLRTLPGIGWGVARQLVARSGDGRELRHLRHLAGFLGVVPTAPSPGDRTERGSIPHTGDPRLRSNLSHASWSALRQDGELRECFRSVCKTPPRPLAARVAMVAVARKLSVRIAVVWMNQRASEISKPLPSAPLTPEETGPQGTPRRPAEPGANTS